MTNRNQKPNEELLADIYRYSEVAKRTPWPEHAPLRAEEADSMLTTIHIRIAANAEARIGRSRVRTYAVAASAIFTLTLLWFLTGSETLVAAGINGELRILTPHPRAGDRIDVEYSAPEDLARQSRLRLRALYRHPWDEEYARANVYRQVALLDRGRDGRFRGSFVLPDSVVYVALAVENESATYVDSRGGQRWEVMIHDDSARITWDAYAQKINELHGRSSEAALATARERAAAFPTDPRAWTYVRSLEQFNLSGAAELLVPQHRARIVEMHQRFADDEHVPNAMVEAMRGYLVQFDSRNDSILRRIRGYWSDARDRRVTQELNSARSDVVVTDPTVANWMIHRLNRHAMSSADSALPALERLEALAARLPRETYEVRMVGYQLARNSGDPEAFLRWADRRSASEPNMPETWYTEPLQVGALHSVVVARLTNIAGKLLRPDDARRPLELTRAEAARIDSAHALRVLLQVARGLELQRDTTGALRVLDRAASIGWDTRVAMRRATLRLALRDTAGAIEPLAQVVVDPGTPASQSDSLARIGVGAGAERWRTATTRAEKGMHAHFLRDAMREVLPESITVTDASGRAVPLNSMSKGTRSVVLFWSPFCPFSRAELAKAQPLIRALRHEGAQLMIVSDQPRSALTDSITAHLDLDDASFYDAQGDAGRAFRVWTIPNYAILDQNGTLRYSNSTADRVLAQVAALR